MTPDWLDSVARETAEFIRFVLLWLVLGSVIAPLRTVVTVAAGTRAPLWLAPVGAAVVATAVYWFAGGVSWRLVGRAWFVGLAVAVLSATGFAFLSLGSGSGVLAGVVVCCWWFLSCGVGVVLTSPTAWRLFRDRMILRQRS